jgi:uncharacterized protein (DUF952 family)
MAAPEALPTFLYKIYTSYQINKHSASDFDHSSGFIHLSTAAQVLDVANRFFSQEMKLFITKIPLAIIQHGVKWESNDGSLFPHLYAQDLDHALPRDLEYVVWERNPDQGFWDTAVNAKLEY